MTTRTQKLFYRISASPSASLLETTVIEFVAVPQERRSSDRLAGELKRGNEKIRESVYFGETQASRRVFSGKEKRTEPE